MMERSTEITTFIDLWMYGYSIRRIPPCKDSVDKRVMFAVVAPDGRELGYAHTDSEIFSAVNRHRQTTPGAA